MGDPRLSDALRAARAADIRDAAVTLFSERGYHGTRMQDIATYLGIQAPSLYNHLTSKQDLLQEVMLERISELIVEHELAVSSTPDVTAQLRRAMEAHVRHCARFPREARISSRDVNSLEEPGRTMLLDKRRAFGDAWVQLVERGSAEGRFHVSTPQLTAYALVQMGLGVALWLRPPAVSESQLVYDFGEIALKVVGASHRPA
jgi:AcrR family transcriptional regulator